MRLFKWLSYIFKAKEMNDEINKKIKKVAIIVGHGNGDPGAEGWNGMSEFSYNSYVAEELFKAVKTKELKIFYRGEGGIGEVCKRAMNWKGDITIELHLNAFNCKAKGCEVLSLDKDAISFKPAKDFADKFCKKFSRILRDDDGVMEIKKGDRGHYSLSHLDDPAPSILVEPFFIDNKDEWIDTNDYLKFLTSWIEGL